MHGRGRRLSLSENFWVPRRLQQRSIVITVYSTGRELGKSREKNIIPHSTRVAFLCTDIHKEVRKKFNCQLQRTEGKIQWQ